VFVREQERAEQDVRRLREWWLYAAATFLLEMMQAAGEATAPVRVSCGWPSRGGMGKGKHVIGQCFAQAVCADGVSQIFISPRIADSIEVLGTLLHELIHAAGRCAHGHGKAFSQPARRLGLVGPPTATEVGPELRQVFQTFVDHMGPYPHASIVVQEKPKVGSRLRLFECQCDPPVKVRVARDEFRAICCGAVHERGCERDGVVSEVISSWKAVLRAL
jgi:SprT-like family